MSAPNLNPGRSTTELPMSCPADTCPLQGDIVWVAHQYDHGLLLVPEPYPRCSSCGSELGQELGR